jgi:hypothetical protein
MSTPSQTVFKIYLNAIFPAVNNKIMAAVRTSEMGTKIASLNVGSIFVIDFKDVYFLSNYFIQYKTTTETSQETFYLYFS